MPFIRNSPTGQTRRRIFTHDGSNDADSRKDVPFGDFFHIASHLGGQKPQFWGVNRRFQAKLAKSKKMHIIKKLHRFQPNFAQWWRPPNGKCPSWVVPTRIGAARKLVGAERSGERPLKNGRSVERSVERDATERAWATERQIGPLRSAHMLWVRHSIIRYFEASLLKVQKLFLTIICIFNTVWAVPLRQNISRNTSLLCKCNEVKVVLNLYWIGRLICTK